MDDLRTNITREIAGISPNFMQKSDGKLGSTDPLMQAFPRGTFE